MRPYYFLVVDFFLNREKCTKFLSKMCVKCRIWLKKYKIFLVGGGGGKQLLNPPSGPHHFHLGYCFLIWTSSLKISVAQLAIMHKKLIWDPAVI
jgi:hypothetical protein